MQASLVAVHPLLAQVSGEGSFSHVASITFVFMFCYVLLPTSFVLGIFYASYNFYV